MSEEVEVLVSGVIEAGDAVRPSIAALPSPDGNAMVITRVIRTILVKEVDDSTHLLTAISPCDALVDPSGMPTLRNIRADNI